MEIRREISVVAFWLLLLGCVVPVAYCEIGDEAKEQAEEEKTEVEQLLAEHDEDELYQRWLSSDLAQVRFSPCIYGKAFKKKDLYGKVVFLGYWGDWLDDEAMRRMARLDAKYRKKGLFSIGVSIFDEHGHRKKRARKYGIIFPIVQDVYGALIGAGYIELPYAVLFDAQGSKVWGGRFERGKDNLGAKIAALLKKAKTPAQLQKEALIYKILEDNSYPDAKSVVKAIEQNKFGIALKKCKLLEKREGEPAEQAQELQANLQSYSDSMFELVEALKPLSPLTTVEILKKITKLFTGSDVCDKAKMQLTAFKKDTKFQAELKAEKEYLAIREILDDIPAAPEDESDMVGWRSKYGSKVRSLKGRVKRYNTRYPDTAFIEKVEQIESTLNSMN